MIKTPFFSVELDDELIRDIVFEKINEKLSDIENERIFYTMDDLQEITGFSKGHITNTFFHDKRFIQIRRKVGRKWVFPVLDTRIFLTDWIKEQPND